MQEELWKADLKNRAYEFIQHKEKVYAREIREVIARYNHKDGYQLVIANTYIDLLVGHVVSRCVQMGGLSKGFEDSVVTGIRSKFSALRTASLKGTNNDEGEVDGTGTTEPTTDGTPSPPTSGDTNGATETTV